MNQNTAQSRIPATPGNSNETNPEEEEEETIASKWLTRLGLVVISFLFYGPAGFIHIGVGIAYWFHCRKVEREKGLRPFR